MIQTVEYELPGLRLREHTVDVPLDWSDPDGPTIGVFAREVVAARHAAEELPLLLFLQGGPGGASPRPFPPRGGLWLRHVVDRYRVVLLDQRGTGRSTPIDATTFASIPADRAADHLAHHLADSIVLDAEAIRTQVYGGRRWTTLGQSYGGFLTLHYLSAAPEALDACIVTGGLASVLPDARALYERTYPRVLAKNARFRDRYPQDVGLADRIADVLADREVLLPDGDRLTVRRFQTLGMGFGMQPGFDELHWLLETAFAADGETLSDPFLLHAGSATGFGTNPLYAALQEAIYASGHGATAWAAEAVRAALPEFDERTRPLQFTGEMVYPWQFREIRALRPFERAVDELAARTEWPELYDLDRLAANEVPVVAAVYFDDMYVDAELQLDTAKRVGNVHTWVTNEFEHDGLRVSDRVLPHLVELLGLQRARER